MPDSISQMTPLLPERADDLQDLALEVVQRSASLGTRQHPVTLRTLRELLRIINSYYSNLIEGHNTHPYDIVRAMQQQYDAEPAKRKPATGNSPTSPYSADGTWLQRKRR